MKVVLELRDQPSNIKKVTVRHDIVIGRGAECNLRLSAPQVSRRHCFLRINGDAATVTDLDSSNGTFVNGKKLTSGKRYELQDGTQLAIGPVQFTARVLSEVTAGDLLEVKVNDDRIEAESALHDGAAFDDSQASPDFDATVADVLPEADEDSMRFAIETGGPAAGEDEPTSDYVSADELGDGGYFSDVDNIVPASDAASRAGKRQVSGFPEPEASDDEIKDNDNIEVIDEIVDANVVEVVDEIIESDAVEVIDVIDAVDEVDIIEDADVELSEDEALVIDAEPEDVAEAPIDDDEPETMVADSTNDIADEQDDSEEEDLRNFLKGLD